jgi:SAM-dependent methyltransferase
LPELLDEAVAQFNPVYQKRVRPYLIDYRLQDYSKLPQGQFSFIFAWNVLNYYTMPKIIRLLPKLERLLRPGGVFMFSYNNSDRYWGGRYVELGKASSVPYRLLSELVQDEGWEIIEAVDIETNISWIEIKRPGVLETAKLHPSLGEIIS